MDKLGEELYSAQCVSRPPDVALGQRLGYVPAPDRQPLRGA